MSTTISASLVKELRDRTGAGMMDCKRALEETGGDLEAARVLLRERGMASAGKRAGRETTEGLVGYVLDDELGTMVGIGCETEPVSKNDEFQDFGLRLLKAVHADGEDAVAAFEQERLELAGRLGENVVVAGVARFEPAGGNVLGAYTHPPANKIGVLVELVGGTPELARQVAMHVSFAAPEWRTRDQVPAETVEAERSIFLNSDEVRSKPEAAREKIVEGMLAKRFYAATPGGVLADQAWIHDAGKTVAEALEEAGRGSDRARLHGHADALPPGAPQALRRGAPRRARVRDRPGDGRGGGAGGARCPRGGHRARDRRRSREHLPWHVGRGRGHGPRDR